MKIKLLTILSILCVLSSDSFAKTIHCGLSIDDNAVIREDRNRVLRINCRFIPIVKDQNDKAVYDASASTDERFIELSVLQKVEKFGDSIELKTDSEETVLICRLIKLQNNKKTFKQIIDHAAKVYAECKKAEQGKRDRERAHSELRDAIDRNLPGRSRL